MFRKNKELAPPSLEEQLSSQQNPIATTTAGATNTGIKSRTAAGGAGAPSPRAGFTAPRVRAGAGAGAAVPGAGGANPALTPIAQLQSAAGGASARQPATVPAAAGGATVPGAGGATVPGGGAAVAKTPAAKSFEQVGVKPPLRAIAGDGGNGGDNGTGTGTVSSTGTGTGTGTGNGNGNGNGGGTGTGNGNDIESDGEDGEGFGVDSTVNSDYAEQMELAKQLSLETKDAEDQQRAAANGSGGATSGSGGATNGSGGAGPGAGGSVTTVSPSKGTGDYVIKTPEGKTYNVSLGGITNITASVTPMGSGTVTSVTTPSSAIPTSSGTDGLALGDVEVDINKLLDILKQSIDESVKVEKSREIIPKINQKLILKLQVLYGKIKAKFVTVRGNKYLFDSKKKTFVDMLNKYGLDVKQSANPVYSSNNLTKLEKSQRILQPSHEADYEINNEEADANKILNAVNDGVNLGTCVRDLVNLVKKYQNRLDKVRDVVELNTPLSQEVIAAFNNFVRQLNDQANVAAHPKAVEAAAAAALAADDAAADAAAAVPSTVYGLARQTVVFAAAFAEDATDFAADAEAEGNDAAPARAAIEDAIKELKKLSSIFVAGRCFTTGDIIFSTKIVESQDEINNYLKGVKELNSFATSNLSVLRGGKITRKRSNRNNRKSRRYIKR